MSISRSIEARMREKEMGLAPHILLYPLSCAYGAAMRVRSALYSISALPSYSLPVRVVSVGNLTVGGTGKTPVAIFLAELLSGAGKKVAVLSRGYKGSARGPAIVSDGRSVLMGPDEAGDEPFLMAERLKGVPVAVSPDRLKGGELLIERFSPSIIILDDGFQHIRLRRDLNILLIDSEEGFGNGFLLPRGTLREPLSALKRADFALVKGGEPDPRVKKLLMEYALPHIVFRYRAEALSPIGGGPCAPLDRLRGKKVVAVSGIAKPGSFISTLAALGASVERAFAFDDHHAYTEADGREIIKAAKGAGMVVTTEKDGVKLRRFLGADAYALRIGLEFDKDSFESSLAPFLRGGW